MRLGARLLQVSQALRGPPCKSMARSKRPRASFHASAILLATRDRPRLRFADDQFIDMGIAVDDGRCARLDDVRDVCFGMVAPERAQQWRREYHVADRAQPDQQNPHYAGITVASSISITGMSSLMG